MESRINESSLNVVSQLLNVSVNVNVKKKYFKFILVHHDHVNVSISQYVHNFVGI